LNIAASLIPGRNLLHPPHQRYPCDQRFRRLFPP
jgi:hypothetical protein